MTGLALLKAGSKPQRYNKTGSILAACGVFEGVMV